MYFTVPPNFVCADDVVTLTKAAKSRPRQPKEFRHLLAAINRRAAANNPGARYVSPHCITAYLPLQGSVEEEIHEVKGPPRPVVPLVLLRGIDTHYRYELMAQTYAAARGQGTVDSSKGNIRPLGSRICHFPQSAAQGPVMRIPRFLPGLLLRRCTLHGVILRMPVLLRDFP